MTNKNRCLFHVITWASLVTLIILVGGLGFHFYAKGHLKMFTSRLDEVKEMSTYPDNSTWTPVPTTTTNTPLPSHRNDSINELPVGGLPSYKLNNNGIKRIPLEGSVNEVPNFFKRFGKVPYQTHRQYVSTTTQEPLDEDDDDDDGPTNSKKNGPQSIVPTTPETSTTQNGNNGTNARPSYPEDNQRAYLNSQLENEIIQPDSNSTYQSEKLSYNLASNGAEAVGEARTPPVYVQSRPVYSKPAPKLPKLLFNPNQLQPKENEINGQGNGGSGDPNLVTQTVYGFLDFVTTIGNTVMVFTPQTKKVEAPKPSATSEIVIQATSAPASSSVTPKPSKSTIVSVSSSSINVPSSKGNDRRGKMINFEESGPSSLIEASEYEPQVFATSFTSSSSSDLDDTTALESRVAVASSISSSAKSSPKQVQHPTPFIQVRSEVNVVAATEELHSPQLFIVTPTVTASKVFPASKGFTLKLPQRSPPVLVSPVSSPLVVTAEKVHHPPPPPPKPSSSPIPQAQEESNPEEDEPTGLVSQTFNTQVEDGVTTVHETKIIGTHIGSQYARIFESSSTVLPLSSSAPVIITPSKAAQSFSSTPTARTEEFAVSEGDNYENSGEVYSDDDQAQHDDTANYDYDAYSHDSHLNDEHRLESNEYRDEKKDEQQKLNSNEGEETKPSVEPTPTASEEQTHYILPQQKEKAEIYISPVPNNNAYSRQPQLYVDINPAKSVDFIVTATPSRGKPGRGSRNEYKNRFTNRFSKNSTPSSDVSEAKETKETKEQERSDDDSGRRTSRFRSRNRSVARQNSEDGVQTVSVYSQVVSATPTRRFGSGRSKTKEFKQVQATRAFQPNARQIQITPSSSSSIYRFKLNRPTGRWRFKPSPKPKVNIIKTQEEEEEQRLQQQQNEQVILGESLKDLNVAGSGSNVGPIDDEAVQHAESLTYEESRTETNEVAQDLEPELAPQTIRVSTVTPSEFEDVDKFLEIATIKSPYVFQAGNVKNTRYITVTKTFTREAIQPTLASSVDEATPENILATRPPYEKILEGSSDVATLPVIALSGDMATPPLETITQSFSTTQLMLKTSILPVLYDGVTTLYTLTQSYFVTRLVTAHKTVPPIELFQFVPTKSLTEFNTALQEAGSEHSEQLLGSEDSDDPDTQYAHIIAPPDVSELTSLGADFDPSLMDDKMPKAPSAPRSKGAIAKPEAGLSSPALVPANAPTSPLGLNGLADQLGLTPEQLAFLQFLKAQKQPTQAPTVPTNFFGGPLVPNAAALAASAVAAPAVQLTSSPVVVDTTATVVETKTLRIQFGAKPTYTTLYSTKIVPTRMTSYVTMSVAVAPTAAAPLANPFFNPAAFPLAYLG